jgi:hypothetical protein
VLSLLLRHSFVLIMGVMMRSVRTQSVDVQQSADAVFQAALGGLTVEKGLEDELVLAAGEVEVERASRRKVADREKMMSGFWSAKSAVTSPHHLENCPTTWAITVDTGQCLHPQRRFSRS